METIKINIYEYSELSEDAKENVKEYMWKYQWHDHIYQEAYNTIDKFCEIFNINIREFDLHNFNDCKIRINIDDDVLQLSGVRLSAYLWNNYKNEIYKGRYYSGKDTKHKLIHKRVDSVYYEHSKKFGNYYYSAIQLTKDCPLTGVCYDMDILQPIYEQIEQYNNTTFEDILKECFHNIIKTAENEVEYYYSDEVMVDNCEANKYKFYEDGTMY